MQRIYDLLVLWLGGVQLRHSVPPVQYIQRIVRGGGCPVVVAQWQSTGCTSQVSWVWFLAAASLFTFLYFRLITISLNRVCLDLHNISTITVIFHRERSVYSQLPDLTGVLAAFHERRGHICNEVTHSTTHRSSGTKITAGVCTAWGMEGIHMVRISL